MDTLSNDAVDGFEVVAARHVSSDMVMLENATDELVLSAGESIVNDDESEYESDNFSETGCADMTTISPLTAGVRGPQSKTVLFPQDCKKLIQVCRGIPRLQQCDDEVKSFQIESLREEAILFIHEEMVNQLILCFLTFLNCIAYCNSRVKDWAGWAVVEAVLLKKCNNDVKVLVIEDCIKTFAFLCQDSVMVDTYPRDTICCKELLERLYDW